MKVESSERRLFSRKLIKTKVVFEDEFGKGLIYIFADDISLGGLFLTSDIPIKVGSYVFLSFCIPGSKIEVRGTGQVVRIEKGDTKVSESGRGGIGIRFVGLSKNAAKAIQEYTS